MVIYKVEFCRLLKIQHGCRGQYLIVLIGWNWNKKNRQKLLVRLDCDSGGMYVRWSYINLEFLVLIENQDGHYQHTLWQNDFFFVDFLETTNVNEPKMLMNGWDGPLQSLCFIRNSRWQLLQDLVTNKRPLKRLPEKQQTWMNQKCRMYVFKCLSEIQNGHH